MKNRRTTLALIAGFLAMPALAGAPADTDALDKAAAYLNSVSTMQARFLQVNADGSSLEGTVYISRPGKMRLEYDPPAKMLMVADGVWFIYVDQELNEVSNIDLDETPAGLLLKKDLSFSDPAVKVLDVKRGPGTIEITTAQAKDPAAGRITFVFSDAPFELRQWRVVDAQNQTVEVTLSNAKTGVQLDSDLFKYEKPKDQRRD